MNERWLYDYRYISCIGFSIAYIDFIMNERWLYDFWYLSVRIHNYSDSHRYSRGICTRMCKSGTIEHGCEFVPPRTYHINYPGIC